MIEAVLFDLDGVLVESEPPQIAAEVEIFNNHGVPLDEVVASQYFGLKMGDYISAIAKHFNRDLDHQAITEELERRLEHMYAHEVPLVEHAAEVVATVSKDYQTALATSRKRPLARMILQRHGLAPYFTHGVYGEDVTEGKPNPEVFLSAAALLGVEPQYCAVIEDAPFGFLAGKQAGMYVVGRHAEHNRNQDFSDATVVIKSLTEIPALLASH